MTKPCAACGTLFKPGYAHKTRRFCTRTCMFTSPEVMEKVRANLRRAATFPRPVKEKKERKPRKTVCVICGKLAANRGAKTCSSECRAVMFASKPKVIRMSGCQRCGTEFKTYPSSTQKFCSYACHLASGGAVRAGLESAKMTRKYGAKKDANHNDICDALKKGGCSVIDLSRLGHGLPDVIVCRRSKTYLVEIKNRETGYGRKGPNKNQKAWADGWPEKVYILKNMEDVENFLNDDLDAIESYGGLAVQTMTHEEQIKRAKEYINGKR